MNMESVSERGTVDISRNSPNPFHVSFHATVKQFNVSCPNSTQNSRYFLAKSTLIPRKIHGKKSRDMRDSTFVSVRDINIKLTVLYLQRICQEQGHRAILKGQKHCLDYQVILFKKKTTSV